MTISVALADDQALVRMGLRVLIESEDDLVLAGEAEDGQGGRGSGAAHPTGRDLDGYPDATARRDCRLADDRR